MNITPEEIRHVLQNYSHVLLTAHVNPDGDAIGDAMVRAFAARGQRACYHKLHLNREGAVVVEELLTDHWSRRK